MKVVVVGGGASGLVSAIYASKLGHDVTILERNDKCGKKILITGNGKCNYWNSDININHYRTDDNNVLNQIISNDNQDTIINFFDSVGVVPMIKNGYYYPLSNQATSISNTLIKETVLCGVKIKNNILVEYINCLDNQFVLNTSEGVIKCDKVILATGSKAAPKTGSDGMGYNFLKKFGHTINTPLPALVQLVGKGNYFKKWSGVRSNALITLYENNEKIVSEIGEVQFTEYGISGVCIFQLSGRVSKGLHHQYKEQLLINLLPWLEEDFIAFMDKRNNYVKNRTISEHLDELLNYKLVNLILELSNIDRNSCWSDLNSFEKETLMKKLTAFHLDIIGTNGFDKCQVCTGGIPLSEINPNTMESIYQKGLYIVGELLDIDGDCGGYNLASAWITGMIAGRSITND